MSGWINGSGFTNLPTTLTRTVVSTNATAPSFLHEVPAERRRAPAGKASRDACERRAARAYGRKWHSLEVYDRSARQRDAVSVRR